MPTRRDVLRGAVTAAAAASVPGAIMSTNSPASAADAKAARNGRVKHSVVYWCFNARGE